jgi:predicted DNA-binding transcriptional regulator AlpA
LWLTNRENMKTLDIKQIAEILHKAVSTIYEDIRRRPNSLPPRLVVPGSAKLLWLESDVADWIDKCRQKKAGRPRGSSDASA